MLMKDRGLTHALVRLFEKREGSWIGALDDAMTLSKKAARSAAMARLGPEQDLDRFIDEALEIDRTLRSAIRR